MSATKPTVSTDEQSRARRMKNFATRAEPTREPEFEGEKTIYVTHNGRQEYPTTLAPHEARMVFDLLGAEFGFIAPAVELAQAERHTWASIANRMTGQHRDASGTEYVTLADAEAAVRAARAAMMTPITAGLPPFDQGERVLIFTEGVEFAGEQFFDIEADELHQLKEHQSEVAAHATHWMPLPRPSLTGSAS